jgi:hypothetical protein
MAGQPTSHPIETPPVTSDPNSTPIQMATPPLSAQASDHFIPGHHRTHSWPLSFDMPTSSPMSTPLIFSAHCTCSSYPCTCNFYSGDMLSPFTHFSTPPPDDLDSFGFQPEDPLGIHHPFGSPHSMPLTGIMPSDTKATPLMFPTLSQTSSHHASPFLASSPSPSMSDLSSIPPASISGDGTDMDTEITWNMLGMVPNPPPNDASLSARLGYVLDCMQRVGFRNFDEMATKYYTAQLEKNSAADLEQKISRSRRLKDFMASLRQSSQGWTRWESRGYCHEIIEGAEHMYVAELQRLLNRLEGGSNEDEKIANNAAHHGSTRSEQDFPSGASDTSDVPSLVHALSSRDENSPIPDRIAPNMSAKVARLFQNEVRVLKFIFFFFFFSFSFFFFLGLRMKFLCSIQSGITGCKPTRSLLRT